MRQASSTVWPLSSALLLLVLAWLASPQPSTASPKAFSAVADVALLERQAATAQERYSAAVATQKSLRSRLQHAKDNLTSIPGDLQKCELLLDQTITKLSSAKESLANAGIRLKDFQDRYPDFAATANRYVQKYSPAPRFGEAANIKAVNEVIAHLNARQR